MPSFSDCAAEVTKWSVRGVLMVTVFYVTNIVFDPKMFQLTWQQFTNCTTVGFYTGAALPIVERLASYGWRAARRLVRGPGDGPS